MARKAPTFFAAALATAAVALTAGTVSAFDASGDEQTLFSLTNQDRTSNGVAALTWNSTLGSIARSLPNSRLCGFTIDGRSQDMVNRNYFSHVICGSHYVWDFMTEEGVGFNSAGENIGWTTAPESDAASSINNAFMNSSEHRANILNANFRQVGMGAAAGTSADSCCGGSSEIMFTEDFIQPTSSAPAPKPSPKPSPLPTYQPPAQPQPQPTRNSPAPPPPSVPPLIVQTPNAPSPPPSPSPAVAGSEVQQPDAQPSLLELIVNRILQTFLNF